MSFKIAFIGAGSVGFTRQLLSDILTVPEFHDVEISFTDINPHNLDMVYQLCQKDIEANGLSIRIHCTLDRREAFKDASYVINTVRIGMLEAFEKDIEVALRYGVDQCVGDTLAAGGIMYGQRGVHAILEFCKDIREVAKPGCIMLNYSNPNAMMTWAANKYGGVKTIGLCHGVQHGHYQIADALGYPKKEVDIICAGINHQTWYIKIDHKGEDMTGKLLEAMENHPVYSKCEKVRIDMLKRFGYYSTESNGHLSEYVAWYRKRHGEIERWIDPSFGWADGETGGYLRICRESRNWFETDFPNWLKETRQFIPEHRSEEHGSYIIESLETGRIYRGHFNVMNNGAIKNLPDECVVEVPGYVDRTGIHTPSIGDLPLGCAAVCSQSIWVQRLSVEAAVAADRQLLIQAMMMDPLTGAFCNTPEIEQMVDEYLIEEAEWLPQYAEEIERAKARMEERKANGTFITTYRDFKGSVRIEERTVESMQQEAEKNRREAAKTDKTH